MNENPAPGPLELGSETSKYLHDLASESFKRQTELDESIWRSLPFFAAIFAFVATVIGRASVDVPRWELGLYSILANVLLIAAAASMAWGLRWFWTVLRPRDYEFPAPDAGVRSYAEEMVAYYASGGLKGDALDAAVTKALRLSLAEQYGAGAAANLAHNAEKLQARSKVLLFVLVSFGFAFACEATIFVRNQLQSLQQKRGVDNGRAQDGTSSASTRQAKGASSDAAEGSAGQGRRALLGSEFQGTRKEQVMSRKPTSTPAPTGPASKPKPPAMQVVTKLNDNRGTREQAGTNKSGEKKK